ncbi:MAG TPA: hypothetical protein DD473_18835 [Planctomycetaceae bacterium]|nr:hypothetical protein [Planctomycetaceae bacterium]
MTEFSESTLVKIGGSLLEWPEFPVRLSQFLDGIPSPILIVGGGKTTDVVRRWDELYQLGEEASHCLAISSLDLTARLLFQLLPNSQLCDSSISCLNLLNYKKIPIILPGQWIATLEPDSTTVLPHHWQTTSDSIALWLSAELRISRLILLKSVDLPEIWDWNEIAELELIDAEFPRLLKRLNFNPSISWENLRSYDQS